MGTRRSDPKNTRDPREIANLVSAIPKRNLSRLIDETDLTQDDFAKILGVSRQTLNGWLSGKQRMTNNHVLHASLVLGVSPFFLLDLTTRGYVEPMIPSLESAFDFTDCYRAMHNATGWVCLGHNPDDFTVRRNRARFVWVGDENSIFARMDADFVRSLRHIIPIGVLRSISQIPFQRVSLFGENAATEAISALEAAIVNAEGDYRSGEQLACDAARVLWELSPGQRRGPLIESMWANGYSYAEKVDTFDFPESDGGIEALIQRVYRAKKREEREG